MEAQCCYSAQHKSRDGSFDSVDSFDVISIDESIDVEMEDAADGDHSDGEMEINHSDDDGEWEEVFSPAEPEDAQVEVELSEGFEGAIEAALASCVGIGVAVADGTKPEVLAAPVASPRWSRAREALRAFYLARAKTSEESSKNFRPYVPMPITSPAIVAQLRAPQRYDVELYERVTRQENARKAQEALRGFYAQRDIAKAQRAAENRANEQYVYESQMGSRDFVDAIQRDPSTAKVRSGHCMQSSLFWETTRFVFAGAAPPTAATSQALSA